MAVWTSNSRLSVVYVHRCCYGCKNNPDKGDCLKYCGPKFWEFISGNSGLYADIIEPLGKKPKKRNGGFINACSKRINTFTLEFGGLFCDNGGAIDWEKPVEFNSSVSLPTKAEKNIAGCRLG